MISSSGARRTGSSVNRLGLTEFEIDRLGPMELVFDWLRLMGFVTYRLSGRKEEFQRSHHVLNHFFSKLKAFKFLDDLIEFGSVRLQEPPNSFRDRPVSPWNSPPAAFETNRSGSEP